MARLEERLDTNTNTQTQVSQFYIHGSVHRDSTNKIQQDANNMQVFIYSKITLHVSGAHRAYLQEYKKLQLQPLVQVIVTVHRYYDLYQRLQLQFLYS